MRASSRRTAARADNTSSAGSGNAPMQRVDMATLAVWTHLCSSEGSEREGRGGAGRRSVSSAMSGGGARARASFSSSRAAGGRAKTAPSALVRPRPVVGVFELALEPDDDERVGLGPAACVRRGRARRRGRVAGAGLLDGRAGGGEVDRVVCVLERADRRRLRVGDGGRRAVGRHLEGGEGRGGWALKRGKKTFVLLARQPSWGLNLSR